MYLGKGVILNPIMKFNVQMIYSVDHLGLPAWKIVPLTYT